MSGHHDETREGTGDQQWAPPHVQQPYPPPYGAPPPHHADSHQLQPPYYAQQVQPVRTNGFAIASLVLGILWLYWVGSILALIFGLIAKGQIDRSRGYEGGRGMAIAGIVLGWIGIGTLILVIVLVAINAASTPY